MFETVSFDNLPILHIEAHGNDKSIEFSNDKFLSWEELSIPLTRIHEKLRGQLIITVAACAGAYLASTAFHSVRAPYFAVLGPSTTINAGPLLDDYKKFYLEFDKTRSLKRARWALNAFKESTVPYFFTTASEAVYQSMKDKHSPNLRTSESTERIEDLVKRLTRSYPTLDVEAEREAASKVILNPRMYVRKSWELFFFIDKYPENTKLFEYPFA